MHVWVRNDDRRTTIPRAFAEEQKHVVGWTAVFDRFVKIGETYERVYSTPDKCWSACEEFGRQLVDAWAKSNSDVDKTHPRLGNDW